MVTDNIPAIPFYFVRHGQTDWNSEGKLMGQNDIPLNNIGIKQAQEVADYHCIPYIFTPPALANHPWSVCRC